MRSSYASCLIALLPSLLLGAACSSGPQPVPALPAGPGPAGLAGFSADRAWIHLEALAGIGPRAVGTPGAERARTYISAELAQLGLDVKVVSAKLSFTGDAGTGPLELANLEATIPGASSDLLVLAAPFDSAYQADFEHLGVNDGASGAALLLEVARVLVGSKLPYSVRLLFLDGEAPLGRGAAEDRGTRYLGSVAAAGGMATAGELSRVRLLLFINRVSDADLQIPRDRFSHRIYRDAIWRTAAELGHADVFTLQSEFEAPRAGHRAFHDRGMRRSVAIIDPHFGSDELPEGGEYTQDDTLARSSAASLALVGEVVVASLAEISAWLQKIDRFSAAPTLPEPEPPPGPEAAPEVETESEAAPGAGSESQPAAEPKTGSETGPTIEPAVAPEPTPTSQPKTAAPTGAGATPATEALP